MAIATRWGSEDVARAVCGACGSTGPMAKSVEAAQFMATLCEWDPATGLCRICKELRGKAKRHGKGKEKQS